jgi:hypothetical protein
MNDRLPWTLPILGDAEAMKNRAATAQAAAPSLANPHCQCDSTCRLAVPSNYVGALPASTMSAAGGQREIKFRGDLRQYFANESRVSAAGVPESRATLARFRGKFPTIAPSPRHAALYARGAEICARPSRW